MQRLKWLFMLLLSLDSVYSFSQTLLKWQTQIPLNNKAGVPFYNDQAVNDIAIDGFEIDSTGRLYFMAGNGIANLAVFDGKRQVFRRSYKEFASGKLHIYHGKLYTYDTFSNDLIVLNPLNGDIIKIYKKLTSDGVNDYTFEGENLILEFLDGDSFIYKRYSLSGKYMGIAKGLYDRSPFFTKDENYQPGNILLGNWIKDFVYWNTQINQNENDFQVFWLVDSENKILFKRLLPDKLTLFGNVYAENPNEHRKVRNGFLYVLGRNGKYALITKVPLNSLFPGIKPTR